MKIRKAAVAGSFYPSDKTELKNMVSGFIKSASSFKINGKLRCIIVPHAGYIYSGIVAGHSYSLLQHYKNKKIKIVLIGPSHHVYFAGIASDVNSYWETPIGKIKLIENNFFKSEEAHRQEHCLEVQIPFLQSVLDDFEVLPLVIGEVNPKEASREIKKIIDDDTILVVSSDLSHYKSYNEAVTTDKKTVDAIEKLDYGKLSQIGDACGILPVLAAVDLANNLNWKCKLLCYKNSGDTSGDKRRVVGYASFALYE